jgi:voltage-gated sodium channel
LNLITRSWWEYDTKVEPLEEINAKLRVGAMLRQAFDGNVFPLEIMTGTPNGQLVHEDPTARRFWKCVQFCRLVTHSPHFSRAMVGLILLSAADLGRSSKDALTTTSPIQWTCKIVFFFELTMRLLAEGFTPWFYFFERKVFFPGEPEPSGYRKLGAVKWWHVFDALVVLGSVASVSINSVYLTRLVMLRLLLVVKKLKRWPKLQLALVTLTEGIEIIGYALILLVLLVYLFALLGFSLFRKNDPWHFGTLHMAMFTILRIATLDNWTDILYTNMYGCDKWLGSDMSESDCTDPADMQLAAAAYFISVLIFGHLILLNSFTGIVIISMGKVLKKMNEEAAMSEEMKSMRRRFGISKKRLKAFIEAFHLINIEQTDCLSVDALLIAMKGADIEISHQALSDVVFYALRQKHTQQLEAAGEAAAVEVGHKRNEFASTHRKSLYMQNIKKVKKAIQKKGSMHMLGMQRVRAEDVKRALAEEKHETERRMKEHIDQGKGFDLRMFVEVMIKSLVKVDPGEPHPNLSMMERYMGVPTWQEIAAGNLLVRNVKAMKGRATLLSAKRTEWEGKLAQRENEVLRKQVRSMYVAAVTTSCNAVVLVLLLLFFLFV